MVADFGFGHGTRLPHPGADTCRRVSGAGYGGAVMDVRHAARRYPGGDPESGIESLHAFSFGPHYDPGNLRFGAMIACNEERLAPGAGFAEHPHSHTEIVTWVVEGELTHRDSTGHETRVRPGDLQRLSAATGVRHTERNDGPLPLTFVQMWLAPLTPGGTPSYDLVPGIADATPYAVPEAGALLHIRRLSPGRRTALPDAPHLYTHVVRGGIHLDGTHLGPGDSARVTDAVGLEAVGAGGAGVAEVLVWEMGGP